MDNLLTATFEAHNRGKNHHRRYTIRIGRDLFDDWTVEIRYSRCGGSKHSKRFASPQADEMKSLIRDRFRRRLSAPRRIGCPYRLTVFTTAVGFDAAAWLPGDIMASFFADATVR